MLLRKNQKKSQNIKHEKRQLPFNFLSMSLTMS
jgi:hypothetical protein